MGKTLLPGVEFRANWGGLKKHSKLKKNGGGANAPAGQKKETPPIFPKGEGRKKGWAAGELRHRVWKRVGHSGRFYPLRSPENGIAATMGKWAAMMVPEIGVEPTTFALRMRCSTN